MKGTRKRPVLAADDRVASGLLLSASRYTHTRRCRFHRSLAPPVVDASSSPRTPSFHCCTRRRHRRRRCPDHHPTAPSGHRYAIHRVPTIVTGRRPHDVNDMPASVRLLCSTDVCVWRSIPALLPLTPLSPDSRLLYADVNPVSLISFRDCSVRIT